MKRRARLTVKNSSQNPSDEDYRRVPTKSLLRRLRIENHEGSTPFVEGFPSPSLLKISLHQHIGMPSVPVVQTGDMVKAGGLIADLPDGRLGAKIHSPLSGKIKSLNNDSIIVASN